jgi:hypothetical protein
MRKTRPSLQRAITVFAFVLVATLLARAQAAQNVAGRKAEEVYKNILVMKGAPASEVTPSMHLMEAQTGMDCTYCHVEERDKDDKPAKQVARQMMLMMNSLNQANFGGQQIVTCYTCHRGQPIPLNAPTILPTSKPLLADPMVASPKIALPSVDQVLAKYIEALGGEQAIRKVTSRVITGTQFIPSGPGGQTPVPATVERLHKAPNLVVNTYKTPTSTIADGFDGTKAWTLSAQGRVAEPLAIDQGRAKRDADFYLPLDLKQQYTRMEVKGIERVNQQDAYLVIGTPAGDLPEKLYFDVLTGLLLRKETALPTPVGNSPFQIDFSDYRNPGSGVKFPYLITMSPASPRSVLFTTTTIRISTVQDNAPIDNAKLARPASRPTPSR